MRSTRITFVVGNTPVELSFHADDTATESVTVHHATTDSVRPGCTLNAVVSGITWSDDRSTIPMTFRLDTTHQTLATVTASHCINESDNTTFTLSAGTGSVEVISYTISGNMLTTMLGGVSETFTRQ